MYETAPTPNAPDADLADFRSDTVTRPTAAMRAAMAAAEVGDDVYGDDPTVSRLEAVVAERLGKDAAVFAASGTQSNLMGVLAWCGRGEELLVGDQGHIYQYEACGASVLGGVAMDVLPMDAGGAIDPAAVTAAVKPDDSHKPITRLLCLENTVNGRAVPLERQAAAAAAARAAALAVHLDGARLMNAAVALNVPPAAVAEAADSVSLCLSKGLGAPIGSVLAGPEPLIRRARRIRKLVGGGMRQVGVLAAAGLHALEHHVDRLAEDHARAARLAEAVGAIPDLGCAYSGTNMVFVTPRPEDHGALTAALSAAGVLVNVSRPSLRFVVHLDLDDGAIDRAIGAFQQFADARAAA